MCKNKAHYQVEVNLRGWSIKLENLCQIPWNFASKTEWKRRGYKPHKNIVADAYVTYWNGQYWCDFVLLSFGSVKPIKGKKAALRRRCWNDELIRQK